MSHRLRPFGSAFTLVELIAVMVILSVLAAATAPIVASAGQAYTDASNRRSAAADLAFALDRAGRTLREAPGPVVNVSATSIELAGGERLALLGSTLWLTEPGGAASPLCQRVGTFQIVCLGEDGRTDVASSPQEAQRLHILAEREGLWLGTVIFLRGAAP